MNHEEHPQVGSQPRQIVPLVKLPPSEWRLTAMSSPDHIGVSVYTRPVGGLFVRVWQKWSILDFPNDLFGVEDLINAGLFGRYIAAIEKEQFGPAAQKGDVTVVVAEPSQSRPNYNRVALAARSLSLKAFYLFQRLLLPRAVSPKPCIPER